MVPDKFNMVDMGGIDLIMMQGEAVPGLYDKLMAAISNCRYQCLYNWLFDGVLIPPAYVQLTDIDGEVYLNEGVSVTSDDVIHIYSIEPAPVDPEIVPLLAEENGVYNVPAGVDGYNPVTVDVPTPAPVIEPITIAANGIYTAPTGVNGYSPVTVNVPGSGYIELQPIHFDMTGGFISSNLWNYSPSSTGVFSDVFEAEQNKFYWLHLGATVDNRFRCAIFPTDPYFATSNINGVSIYSTDSPIAYSSASIIFKAPYSGFIVITKSNRNIAGIKSYAVECTEIS